MQRALSSLGSPRCPQPNEPGELRWPAGLLLSKRSLWVGTRGNEPLSVSSTGPTACPVNRQSKVQIDRRNAPAADQATSSLAATWPESRLESTLSAVTATGTECSSRESGNGRSTRGTPAQRLPDSNLTAMPVEIGGRPRTDLGQSAVGLILNRRHRTVIHLRATHCKTAAKALGVRLPPGPQLSSSFWRGLRRATRDRYVLE